MVTMYGYALGVTAAATAAATAYARRGQATKTTATAEFRRFQLSFLLVYYICMTADWLQGPYVYALYASYGFSKHDIAVLFVGGFGASMVFGTFVGAAADRLGRRRLCLLYCILYILSCATKHARDYWVLMLGRILGGVATSLLFSSFESWMVCEHNARGHDAASLSETFSLMYFGNSLCAIMAGMVAEAAADAVKLTPLSGIWHYGGYCSPFDLSALCLVIGFALISATWGENYGNTSKAADLSNCSSLEKPLNSMKKDARILLIGVIVSLFEGSMYIFVFNWTPSLSSKQTDTPPFGFIFAIFMVACMGGSSLFSILVGTMPAESMLRYVFIVAAMALAVPTLTPDPILTLGGMCVFEACVGMYWPAIGTVKSQESDASSSVVPEETRATIYNIFRVPLNAVVLAVLLNHMDVGTAFTICAIMLVCCGVAQTMLFAKMSKATVDVSQKLMSSEESAGFISSTGSDKDY
ncbi:hypothetical protein AB1Y20_003807 [Prymnesium parvum]|uniref:Molybdate-anion transporter n=1 Tax=Prymnesium parvum TaxID=97485 RepID=A0AB34J7B6_PRYPA